MTSLWDMLEAADDAGVVSQSPEQPRKMIGVVVVVCAGFGLTVLEEKTKIVRLRTKGIPESRFITKRTSSYTSGGTSTTLPTCPSRTGAYATHGAASRRTPSNCTTNRALPWSSKFGY